MIDNQKTEKEVLKFWKEKKIYEKSVKKNSKGKAFYMMDGPPYATGHIHMGTALNKVLKDIAMRSQRLQGKNVLDTPGYDTHGLPIEFQIEKEIGSKAKKDIEKYGVKKFVSKCRNYATKYIDLMNEEFANLGVWMDWKKPYITLKPEYIEVIWDTFKKADEKGLLYLGKYPVHVCPRCETAVAYNEIEYHEQEDNSVYVKFPLRDKKNTFLIIWTTTPWTLPGNTGVMVNPNVEYSEVEVSNKERWIIAKPLIPEIMTELEMGYTIKKTFKGKEMKGWQYENPLSENLKIKVEKGYYVILSSRYVTTEEGTGLVHCAPGHGKEDYDAGKENGLDIISPVAINGEMTEEAGKYSGKRARVVDEEIIGDLKKLNALVYKKKYSHDYPFCWRCKTPLLMIALPQWFFRIDEIQEKLLRENKEVKWNPKYMELRMNAWLEGISDWPISRDRYWGTPLPIWKCEKCDNKEVIGSIKELEQKFGKKIKEIHKPEIDEVKLKCKCGGVMLRVPEVLDVWFDSGVSSWAALNYPREDEKFRKFWPADLNIEGKDQVRGWWNSQIILSEIRFGKKPFESICVHGMVLDLGKKKMSKSLGNIVSPQDIINKYGRDYLRYYFAKISKGEDFAFDEKEFKEIQKVFVMLENVNNFVNSLEKAKEKSAIEDKWILSRFNSLVKNILEDYNNYLFMDVVQKIEKFLIEDLSRNYIKIIRGRSDEVSGILNEIRIGILKLLAPIIPFATESIWQELKNKKIVKEESVHLCEFPKAEIKKINVKLEQEFENVFVIIEKGLAERDKTGIGLKWPLAKAIVKSEKNISEESQSIIASQLNVKKIEFGIGNELKVELDTNLTPELEAEGFARNIARAIQALRKKSGLVKEDKIDLTVKMDKGLILLLDEQKEFIKERTNARTLNIDDKVQNLEKFEKDSLNVKGKEITIALRKI